MGRITSVFARRILDSKGNPTLEVDITLDSGILGRAAVPSGTSKGTREAIELRDRDSKRYFGRDVQKAIENVNHVIAPAILGMDVTDQEEIDRRLIKLDGTEMKSRVGANAILGVSLAAAKAAAQDVGMPLYRYIAKLYGEENPRVLPVPLLNVINGGCTGYGNNLDFQAFMIIPIGAESFSEAIRKGAEVFQSLYEILVEQNNRTIWGLAVGDEGGFSPRLKSNKQALELIVAAIRYAGYEPGKDMVVALDPAASQFFKEGRYVLHNNEGRDMTSHDLVRLYESFVEEYPFIISIEDGMAEDDWEGWKLLTEALGERVALVGEDIFVTDKDLLLKGIKEHIANAISIMPNQVGTLTETLETIRIAKESGYTPIVSHRSGETYDTTISDIAVGCSISQIKAGGLSRVERVEKYNRLMRIEEELGANAMYISWQAFSGHVRC